LYAPDVEKHHPVGNEAVRNAATAGLADPAKGFFTVSAPPDQVLVRSADTMAFLLIRYFLA
jgi:hypothetical protein